MGWTFFFLMVALKVPLIAAIWIIWWAVKQEPDPAAEHRDDGGSKHRPHPRRPFPRRPRRGPHGDPTPASPPRVRTTVARSRTLEL